jgi:hypothetical protein
MIIKKLIIADYKYEEANIFDFESTANIIIANDNTQGKSCLLKSLFFALGMDIKTFKDTWCIESKMFKLFYEHNNSQETIIRCGKNFWINDNKDSLDQKGYAKWLLKTFNINILLPINHNDELRTIYPSAVILPFYVDQDNSWSRAIYKNVVNELGLYKQTAIPKNIFEYIFKISTDEIIEKEEEKQKLNNEKNILLTQKNTLQALKDDFLKNSCNVNFDENDALEDIKKYLIYAKNINSKISERQAKIYTKEIELDSYKLKLSELNELLENTESAYKKIEKKCSYCDSELTTEQSLRRLKLNNNSFEIGLLKNEINKKIEKLDQELQLLLQEKISLEKDYSEILKISEKKYGDYTLPEYIEDKAKKITKDNYYKIETKLSLNISNKEDVIKFLQKRINELKKSQKEYQENISSDFEKLKISFKMKFPEVNIDDRAFLDFKGIKNSGATKNTEFFILYMIYIKLLIMYSCIEMPFGFDSPIKDELDGNNIKKFYEIIEETILTSEKQSFVVMLQDKLKYLKNNNYKFINLQKPILNKSKFEELKDEFSIITSI